MKKEVAAGEMETLGSDFALLAPRTCCNDIRLFSGVLSRVLRLVVSRAREAGSALGARERDYGLEAYAGTPEKKDEAG